MLGNSLQEYYRNNSLKNQMKMLRKKEYMRKKGTFKFYSFKTSFFCGFNNYKALMFYCFNLNYNLNI